MKESQRSAAPPPEPISSSLGTLFLVVTTAGAACVAYRIPGGSFWLHAAAAMIFAGAFLMMWFVATRQFERLRVPGALVVGGVALYALILPSVKAAANARMHARANCGNRLRQIGLALFNYHEAYGSFPPEYAAGKTGKPLYSWRVSILPYVDEGNLAKSFRHGEPWDGPNNVKIAQTPIFAFSCPEDPQSAYGKSRLTSYLAVVGPNTAWAGSKPRTLSEFKNPSKTVLLVEVANSGINWAEPRDLFVDRMSLAINPALGQGISSGHDGGAWVLFADDHVEFLPDTTDPKKLQAMLDLDGCNDHAAIDGDSR